MADKTKKMDEILNKYGVGKVNSPKQRQKKDLEMGKELNKQLDSNKELVADKEMKFVKLKDVKKIDGFFVSVKDYSGQYGPYRNIYVETDEAILGVTLNSRAFKDEFDMCIMNGLKKGDQINISFDGEEAFTFQDGNPGKKQLVSVSFEPIDWSN